MTTLPPLSPDQLYRRCDPALLDFETTDELPGDTETVGQDRAAEAVRFALDIKRSGYNLYVLGEPGSGRHAMVLRLLSHQAAGEATPADWCYVNNFAQPDRPRLLQLPPGRGAQFKHDMQQFVEELPTATAAAFESDEYRARVEAIHDETKKREEAALRELGRESGEHGLALLGTPQGFVFAPVKDDRAMEPAEFSALPEAEQKRLGGLLEEYGERLHKLMQQFPRWRREMRKRVAELTRETMGLAVGHLIEDLKERYTDLLNVLEFLDQVLRDVLDLGTQQKDERSGDAESAGDGGTGGFAQRYLVNLLVDHGSQRAAPVVFEDHPTYPNLVGRVEQVAHMGTLVTNFTMIKAGALHRANGGYLILDIEKVLAQPYAWEGLKRALNAGELRIESLGQVFGWAGTQSLDPEAMPLSVKVVLVGSRMLYYLLREYDPEFGELFKIAADFEDAVERNDDNVRLFSRLIATLARKARVRPLAAEAVARVIEHGARLAEDAERLAAGARRITDLLLEADHLATRAGQSSILKVDIEAALAAQRRRADRLPTHLLDAVQRGLLMIATEGEHIGQINGLAVYALGDAAHGHPVRITATARLGDGEVVDIERESQLGRAIHSKGVLILTSFLAARYASESPLSLNASLVFEQSYGPVEGDSASMAELCALLSVLAGVPIKQSLAMTGSVNQFGDAQAIGGVNEKIEGFFDVCNARGLSGEQGVLIPQANVRHLMLREDVVNACAAGKFHVTPYASVDEAIELLTGMPAGEADDEGNVAPDSINGRVALRLAELTALRQAYAKAASGRRRAQRKAEANPEPEPDPQK